MMALAPCQGRWHLSVVNVDVGPNAQPCLDCAWEATVDVAPWSPTVAPPALAGDGRGDIGVAYMVEGAMTPHVRFFGADASPLADEALGIDDSRFSHGEGPTEITMAGWLGHWAVGFSYEQDNPQYPHLLRFGALARFGTNERRE